IGGGIGAEHLEAERLAEIEGALVGVVILCEALDAPGPGDHAKLLADGEERLDGLRLVDHRAVLLVELAIPQAEILHPLEGPIEVELAERVALGAETEAAEDILLLLLAREGKGRQGGGGETGKEKRAAVDAKHEVDSWRGDALHGLPRVRESVKDRAVHAT